MSEISKKYGAPALPSVNLLPSDIAEKRKVRAVQVSALIAIVIALCVIVAAYLLALGAKELARSDREDARSEQQIALEERDQKAPVYDAYRQREVQEYTLTQIGSGEIDYASLSAAVLSTATDETSFDVLTFRGPNAVGSGSASVDPVSGGGIGSVTFSARATSPEEADALVSRIEAVPGIANVAVQSSAFEADGAVDYVRVDGTAVVTELPLTLRLVPQDGVTALDPAAISGGASNAEPSASPTPQPSATETEES